MSVKNRSVLYEVMYINGNFCWLNGKMTRGNPMTAHHITPVRFGGKATIKNIAPLTDQRHKWFNQVEIYYPDLAEEVNDYFREYHGQYPEEIEWRINQIFALVDPARNPSMQRPKCKTKCKSKKRRR